MWATSMPSTGGVGSEDQYDSGAADLKPVREAMGRYARGLDAARESGDRAGQARILSRLGLASASLGEAGQAIAYHEQALGIARETGDRRAEGQQLKELADACWATTSAPRSCCSGQ